MTPPTAAGDRPSPIAGQRVQHGPGVTATRAFPTNAYQSSLDPFVLFERFFIDPDRGFPMHRHEGFEIVSYMLEGGMEHEDSLGVEHTASENEAMYITAGRGISHSEFPADDAACSGLQLWINLPPEAKDAEPGYADATAAELPTDVKPGATVTTVVGDGSPFDLHTPMEYVDVHVTDAWTWTPDEEWAGFLFGTDGTGAVDGHSFGEGDVLPITNGRQVEVTSDETLRAVAVSGRPHDEPIRLRGPVVR
ncbi:Pirin-related protein [Halovivax ruber XH-70]|uniref:Pirin-related protein n=1 Tax=Halovivax ruber (strain DSM 18193 / JCM 13892 / XH-70) TaxID=797302 RepID=L0I7J5_HALRX|nr:pirin family protein [Halovivax ruber]AGB15545.1 Pirin-related protein [Halovivax ruber XH-70]